MEYIGTQYRITIDMREQLNKLAYQCLTDFQSYYNCHLSNLKEEKALYQWFLLQSKVLSKKCRKIEKAKEFICPDGMQSQLDGFEKAVRTGQDLIRYMSRNVLDVDFEDKMFSDWRFLHFHLSNPYSLHPVDKRFLKRSEYLLIAYVDFFDDSTVYFLQIVPHIKDTWTNDNLIRILVDNWPIMMKKDVFEGSLTATIKGKDRSLLRENNINSAVDLGDGRVVIGPGLGVTGIGASTAAELKSMNLGNRVQFIEMSIGENVDAVGELIHWKLQNEQTAYRLKLEKLLNAHTACFQVEGTPAYLGVNHNQFIVADSSQEILCQLDSNNI